MKVRRLAIIILALMVLAVLTVSELTYESYQRDIRMARARVAAGSRIARTRCGPVEYAVAGHGPPVLVVHGAGGGYDQGLDIGAPLVRAGFQVIAPSRFGYLRTPLPQDASPQAQADAYACLLDTLGIPHAAIMGASAGAPSTLLFTLRYPQRSRALVLLVPGAYAPMPGGQSAVQTPSQLGFLFDTALKSDFLFWLMPRINRTWMYESVLGTPASVADRASSTDRAFLDTMLSHILPIQPRRAGILNDARVVASLSRYDLEHIATPTLILSAADDLYGTDDIARYTAAQIPDARLIGYTTGGHLLIGHRQQSTARIIDFLRE